MPDPAPTPVPRQVVIVIPDWLPSGVTLRRLVLAAALFGGGYLCGGGKLHLPALPDWLRPTPSRPSWMPDEPPPPPPPFTPVNTPSWEWRVLPSDPNFEGEGREVDGEFLFRTWRPRIQAAPPVQAAPPPVMTPAPLLPMRPMVFRGPCFGGACN